jgi:ATP-dependent RNA helicase DeaD
MTFDAAHPALIRALTERGYTEPTPVQAAVLGAAADRDLLVSAQTGSGKTVAFGIALATTLLGTAERLEGKAKPRALVVAPTRELAQQVQKELTWLFAHTGARIVVCVGGVDIRREQYALAQGAHIVVGTPGRLCDHLDRGNLDGSTLAVVVLDEADEMLDLGFRDELERILAAAPTERKTLLFSATIPRPIAMLAKQYQQDALRVVTATESEPHGDIEYRAMPVVMRERDHAVVNVLRYLADGGALVFCATREGVTHLYGNLLERGFAVVPLSGELSQNERNRALQALRDGRAKVCVATDVAARGLDLPDLGLVVHADLPQNRATLLHRSGRTGRAGRKGTCVVLVPQNARGIAARLFSSAKIEAVWSPPPSADEVRSRDQERLIQHLASQTDAAADDDLAAAKALLAERSAEDVVAMLVRLQRGLLPSPEELSASLAAREPVRTGNDERVTGDTVWFRLNIGRANNADPRWLIPLICRRGHVTRRVIGKIQISFRETRFEIAADAAERFAAMAAKPDPQDRNVQIERVVDDGDAGGRPARGPRPAPRTPRGPRSRDA